MDGEKGAFICGTCSILGFLVAIFTDWGSSAALHVAFDALLLVSVLLPACSALLDSKKWLLLWPLQFIIFCCAVLNHGVIRM